MIHPWRFRPGLGLRVALVADLWVYLAGVVTFILLPLFPVLPGTGELNVVTSLTILAALALIGYAVGGESRPELAAIAGTAVGALAGATTSVLANRQHAEPTKTFEEGEDH